MTAQINAVEAPAVVKHPLAERVEKLLDEKRWAKAVAVSAERELKEKMRAGTLARLPELWESSGLLALVGDGEVVDEGDRLVVQGRALVGDVAVSVQLSAPADSVKPWVALGISAPPFRHSDSYFRATWDAVGDITDYVVEKVLLGVEKAQTARDAATALLEQAEKVALAWEVWDDACRWHAGKVTRALFEPVEMWRLTRPLPPARDEEDEEELVVLEAPQDVAAALADGKPALVTVVGHSGCATERWIFGAGSMQEMPPAAPTIEDALPYHHSFWVGRYFVNVPVTVPATAPEVVELVGLTAHKKALSTVLGVEDPTGRWAQVCRELDWVYPAHEDESEDLVHESYWPKKLAKMTVDEIVDAWGDSLARARRRG